MYAANARRMRAPVTSESRSMAGVERETELRHQCAVAPQDRATSGNCVHFIDILDDLGHLILEMRVRRSANDPTCRPLLITDGHARQRLPAAAAALGLPIGERAPRDVARTAGARAVTGQADIMEQLLAEPHPCLGDLLDVDRRERQGIERAAVEERHGVHAKRPQLGGHPDAQCTSRGIDRARHRVAPR
jgi:hypothetical protein